MDALYTIQHSEMPVHGQVYDSSEFGIGRVLAGSRVFPEYLASYHRLTPSRSIHTNREAWIGGQDEVDRIDTSFRNYVYVQMRFASTIGRLVR